MSVNATPCSSTADSYLTVEEADAAMGSYFQAAKWAALSSDQKELYLKWATRMVGQFAMWPPKQQSDQALDFPTSKDPVETILGEVKRAVLATIDMKLENKIVTLKQQQAEGVTSASLLGQSKSFNADPSGLPAEARRELQKVLDSYQTIIVKNPDSCGDIF